MHASVDALSALFAALYTYNKASEIVTSFTSGERSL